MPPPLGLASGCHAARPQACPHATPILVHLLSCCGGSPSSFPATRWRLPPFLSLLARAHHARAGCVADSKPSLNRHCAGLSARHLAAIPCRVRHCEHAHRPTAYRHASRDVRRCLRVLVQAQGFTSSVELDVFDSGPSTVRVGCSSPGPSHPQHHGLDLVWAGRLAGVPCGGRASIWALDGRVRRVVAAHAAARGCVAVGQRHPLLEALVGEEVDEAARCLFEWRRRVCFGS